MKPTRYELPPLFGFRGWLLIVSGACVVFGAGLWGIVLLGTYNLAGNCANEILQEIPSPDNKFVAVIFQRNCGATTGYTTEVSVLPMTENLPDEGGNAFWLDSDLEVEVEWTENRQLKVISADLPDSFREKRQVGDIQVIYEVDRSVRESAISSAEKNNERQKRLPQFADYLVTEIWRGRAIPLRLRTKSERMFRTQLTEASKEPPDFAGHYRFAGWGCGSVCGAGAIINLKTGSVYPPPLGGKGEGWERWMSCTALLDGTGYEYHLNSRLMIVRCGWNFDEHGQNHPDVYYFLWKGNRFRLLHHFQPPRAR